MVPNRCLRVAILLTAFSSAIAYAAERPSGAEPASAKVKDQQVVGSIGADFAIIRAQPAAAAPRPPRSAPRARIKLGTAHRFDRSIFRSAKPEVWEAVDADR